MQFTLLVETPANSGSYAVTGNPVDMTAGDAVNHALDLIQSTGNRYALAPYDAVARSVQSTAQSGPPVVYSGADATAIVAANVAVTVFDAGSVPNGATLVNSGANVLYIDPTGATAVAGSATAIALAPGATYHFSYPPAAGVSAVASEPQSFVAVRW